MMQIARLGYMLSTVTLTVVHCGMGGERPGATKRDPEALEPRVQAAVQRTAGDTGDVPGLPPGAKSVVLELRFPVEALAGGKVEGLVVREAGTEVRIELAADVLFDFDSATLLGTADRALAQAAHIIRARAVGAVRIEGHTDNKGTAVYNQRLSERRAESVRQWFRLSGLTDVSFTVRGFGASQPAMPNVAADGTDDPDARARNRRVEVVITIRP